MDDLLTKYRSKRDFTVTSEPQEGGAANESALSFVIQKHWARNLHYDFRLELGGTLKSWAVPKGPSLDPHVKRMAVQVEDHPLSYAQFEGEIPAGQYGAGNVIVWDNGIWLPRGDARQGLREGKLKFELQGHKLRGSWSLVRMRGRTARQETWLLIKDHDDEARAADDYDITEAMPDSVKSDAARARPAGSPPAEAAEARPVQAQAQPTQARSKPRAKASAAAIRGQKPVARKVVARTAASNTAAPKTTSGNTLAGSTIANKAATTKTALPTSLSPQLATLVEAAPGDAADWLFEIKFDGYRLVTRIEDGKARCFTRNGNDWTGKLPELRQALEQAALPDCWLDGEIVVLNDQGISDFQTLQNAFDEGGSESIVYYVFDLPFLGDQDLRPAALTERRTQLQALLGKSTSRVRLSEAVEAAPDELLGSACTLGFEGIIGKRKSSPYRSSRSLDWIKLKCGHRQEFVIAGYTDPKGSRIGIGALLLAVHDAQGKLRYAGNVGTGFSDKVLGDLLARLRRIETSTHPFDHKPKLGGAVHWVEPQLLAEISFAAWTRTNYVRHAVFHGLRTDKPPVAVTRETPIKTDTSSSKPSTPAPRKKAESSVEKKLMATTKSSTRNKPAASATSSKSSTPAKSTRPPASRKSSAASTPPEKKTLPSTSKSTKSGPLQDLPTSQKVTHPERVIDGKTGVTKLDLVACYARMAPLMLPHLEHRPLALVRAPDGLDGELFFQKHASGDRIHGIVHLDPKLDPGHAPLFEIENTEGLLGALQMNAIEFHTWNAVSTALDAPDRMTFDLDPGENLPWEQIRESAKVVRAFLNELDLPSFLKTSGGKGLHVVVPLKPGNDWDTVRAFSHAIVDHLANTLPDHFVAKSGPRNRVGKLFIDYLRNGFGATTVAAWSVRARPGLGISVPVAWEELDAITRSDHWSVLNVDERLAVGNMPWKDYEGSRTVLTKAMKTLGFEAAKSKPTSKPASKPKPRPGPSAK